MTKPLVASSLWKPDKAAEMLSFTVWYFLGTEMPYPSSHTLMSMGTSSTHAAFMDSQNNPSDVLASPIVPTAISLPPLVKVDMLSASSGIALNTLLAWASPTNRGIWPPVGLMSAELLKSAIKSFQVPSSFKVLVAK